MAQKTQISHVPFVPTGNAKLDQLQKLWAINSQSVYTDIKDLFDTSAPDAAGLAPTNNPTPSGITIVAQADGSMRVTLTWNYTDGVLPADAFVVLWKQGVANLTPLTTTDHAISLAATSRSFTFEGLNPGANFRFGLASARKGSIAGSFNIGTIQQPTSAPDWADINTTGNYTSNVGGTAAATLVANASDGRTAFDDTVNYRTAGAPTNAIDPTGLIAQVNTDGSVDYTLQFNYTQGARKADGFYVFVQEAGTVPDIADPHFTLTARNLAGALGHQITLKGYPTDRTLSFGVAAFRRTELAIEVGTITGSAASPDWTGVSSGTPNYVGFLSGTVQHNITARAAGQFAGNYAQILVDNVLQFNTGARSWHLASINASGQLVTGETFDVFGYTAELINFRLAYNALSSSDILVALGSQEPQTRRTQDELFARLVTTGDNTFGKQWAVTGLTGGQQYSLSAWVLVTGISGTLVLDVVAPGLSSQVSTWTGLTGNRFVKVTNTFTLPAGQTTATIRFFGSGVTTCTAFLTSISFVAGATPEAGSNLMLDPHCQNTGAWVTVGAGTGTWVAMVNTVYTPGVHMIDCLRDMGGTRQLLLASTFKFRSAYALIGKKGVGDGNGLEAYSGKVDNGTESFVEVTAQSQSGTLVALSGIGWSPSDEPGPPTNAPAFANINTFPKATGTVVLTFGWSYTQPVLEGNNRLADGFMLYVRGGTSATPWVGATATYKLDVAARSFTFEAPFDQTWSFGLAAYRKTRNGLEVGTQVTNAAWQGVGGTTLIDLVAAPAHNQVTTSGAPTNACSALGITVTARDVGSDTVKLTWSYTQPSNTGTNKLADGFYLYVDDISTGTPWASPVMTVPLDVSVRGYTIIQPKGQVWSFGIAPFRKSISGIQVGTQSTTAAWQGVTSATVVVTNGLGTNAVTTAKIANDNVTTAKRQLMSTQSVVYSIIATVHSHVENTAAAYTQNALTGNRAVVLGSQNILFTHSLGREPLVTVDSGNNGVIVSLSNVNTTSVTVFLVDDGTATPPNQVGIIWYW